MRGTSPLRHHKIRRTPLTRPRNVGEVRVSGVHGSGGARHIARQRFSLRRLHYWIPDSLLRNDPGADENAGIERESIRPDSPAWETGASTPVQEP
jgi:hypothetical protein